MSPRVRSTSVFSRQDRQCKYNVALRRVNATIVAGNHCCSGKAIRITCSEGVSVALGTQHVMRMPHIVICGLPGCTKFFPNYLINGKIFGKVIEHKMCVLIFSTTFVRNISHSKTTERDMIKNVYWSLPKVLVILVRLQ